MNGFFVIDKPAGVTSFAMVKLVRRLTGVRRVGHAGTLDPMATGVLPVAVGQATRLIEYTDGAPKSYAAQVRFGVSTDTYDAEGERTGERDPSGVTQDTIEAVLPEFTGDVQQRPPLYSALKLAGRPLYRYAREGVVVDLAPRAVRIDCIEFKTYDAATWTAEVVVECGKGTYIRSLANDIGERLGCGAHLADLRRLASAGFSVADAHTPDELASAAGGGWLEDLLLAPDRVLESWPVAILNDETAGHVRCGRQLSFDAPRHTSRCRAYSTEGRLLAVLTYRADGSWHPEKVLPMA